MGFSLSIASRMCSIGGMKRYIVNLTAGEREALTQLVGRERVSGLKRQRASILLKADDGLTDAEIAEDLGVGLVTVERVRQRCCERGVAGCLERKAQENPSRPRKLDGASEAQLVRLACSEPPAGRTRWTLTLLADKLVELKVFDSVSKSTVQRGLKKTNSSPGR
jgi:transposase